MPEKLAAIPSIACFFQPAFPRRVHPVPRRQLRHRQLAPDRVQRHATPLNSGKCRRLVFITIGPSFHRRNQLSHLSYFPGPPQSTNAIEALNAKLRRAVRARGHFPTDEAAMKMLYLVLNRSEKDWIMPPREWSTAKAQFAVIFGDRFTV